MDIEIIAGLGVVLLIFFLLKPKRKEATLGIRLQKL